MKENAIRTDLGGLRLSAILFDEAFQLNSFFQTDQYHRHADYEIFFVLQGTLTVSDGTKSLCAEKEHAVILPPLYEHKTAANDLRGYCLYFNLAMKAKTANDRYASVRDALKSEITVLPLEEAEIFYLHQFAKAVGTTDDVEEESHLIALLFSRLFRRLLPRKPENCNGKSLRYINVIDHYIAEHYREKLRLSDLARALYLCPKQVTRIIQKKYGCTFSDLLNGHRLALARTMLRSTEESVSAIAASVGYDCENYFYTLFRKNCGMTPGEYRRKRNHFPPSGTQASGSVNKNL